MRKGENISKEQPISLKGFNHRVIIPLYIPNEEDYYKDAWQIFTMCITSLLNTIAPHTAISIVSNGSSKEINSRLLNFCLDNDIDQLIIEEQKIGKINSILRALKFTREPFVTITDADILFLNGWLNETSNIFQAFPKAAAVSPLPVFRTQNHYTSNIIFDYLFSTNLKFTKVTDPEGLTKFAKSIGWSRLDEKWKDFIMTIGSDKMRAVVGCNHAVVTYRTEIFKKQTFKFAEYALGGETEGYYLDRLPQLYDGYRLATEISFARHMGNQLDESVITEFKTIEVEKVDSFKTDNILKYRPISNFLKNIIFKKILNKKSIKRLVYLNKGLPSSKIENFI
ncbi:glycosyltransferase family A protein [Croceibacter atlanticus]|uniref:glycosyltransferase family A protein n=1 Tax=Croceibacter atlanticus TaxID=313588 RepID=UPI0030F9EBD7